MPQTTALAEFREEIAPMRKDFGVTLPSNISPEKFEATVITAIEHNPDLLTADRQSLKLACMDAANDGLLPDKKEGALVIFNTKVKVRREGSNALYEETRALVQWMPMIAGILKKVHQTGMVDSLSVEMVHKNDHYRRAAGDDAKIDHVPLDFGDRGEIVGGYAIVKMRGSIDAYREVMSKDQIERIRNISRAKDASPWTVHWEEMAKKTILRRLLKRVPLTADVDRVLSRDDVLYNFVQEQMALAGGGGAAIPKKSLFGNRAVVRKAEPAPLLTDETAATPAAIELPMPLQEALDDLQTVDTLAGVTLLEEDCRPCPWFTGLSEEHKGVFQAALDARRAHLQDTSRPFVLQATLTKRNGLQQFDDVDMWVGDIQDTVRRLNDEQRAKFWEINNPHIDAAEAHHPEAVAKLRDFASKHAGAADA